ncbi:MAG: hypothetical protein R2695_06180 [Acidimicrobiales bacterium]
MSVRIVAACRSPFSPVGGALAGWHPVDLAAAVLRGLLERGPVGQPGTEGQPIDEVWLGCAEPVGAQGADMARAAVLAAGWDQRIGGTVIERAETSGSAAVHAAVAAIAAGQVTNAVVLGVSLASTVPPGAGALGRIYGRPWGDGPAERAAAGGGLLPGPVAADRAALHLGIDRDAQEQWTARSCGLRPASSRAVLPVEARPGEGVAMQRGTLVTTDAGRPEPATPSSMAPAFEPGGTTTGYTFAPPVDGAAAALAPGGAGGPGRAGRRGHGSGRPATRSTRSVVWRRQPAGHWRPPASACSTCAAGS